MKGPLAWVLACAVSCVASDVQVYNSSLSLKVSETKPGNLLPKFLFQLGKVEGDSGEVPIGGGLGEPLPFSPYDTAPDEIWNHANADLRGPALPYLWQDEWGCERTQQDVSTIAFESDRLKLSITPQWGGRVWSVYDKELGRDWTFSNPAHQPANIAVLKAWTSGGVEFNWSPGIPGHSVFAESPAWVGKLETERGPVLRMWEYDRRNQSVWQVDLLLDGDKFYFHPKITNTQPEVDLQGYWWTCIAVPATPATRVITPAEWTCNTSPDGNAVGSPWPHFSMGNKNGSFTGHDGAGQTDNSFLASIWQGDFFMGPLDVDGLADGVNYIAYAESDGFVGFHGHQLNGTKFFSWGQSGSGRFMQDLLGGISGPEAVAEADRVGDYAELQVGPAFTQMQTFDLPHGATLEWTEVLGAFVGDQATLASDDYAKATGAVEGWMAGEGGIDSTVLGDVNAFLASVADLPVDEVLSAGMPWGAVEETRRGESLAPGVTFDKDLAAADPESTPWLELASEGSFSAATIDRLPLSYQIGDEWLQLLLASEAQLQESTWLHDLHIGVALAERGEVKEPVRRFAHALRKRPNAIAARCLAVLRPTTEEAWPLFQTAWVLALNETAADDLASSTRQRLLINLATEVTYFLQGAELWDELAAFVNALPVDEFPDLAALDSVLLSRVYVALRQAQPDTAQAIALLADPTELGCFATLGSARATLMELWFEAHEVDAASSKGSALSLQEARDVRVAHPVPRNIGCPYAEGSGYNTCTYW